MDDVWSAPSGDKVAAAPAPVRVVYRLERERIVAAWPEHVRATQPFHHRPDVRQVLVGAAAAMVAVGFAPASLPVAAAIAAAALVVGLARARSAWRRAAEAAWTAADGVAWRGGDLVQVEVSGERVAFRSSVSEIEVTARDLVRATRHGDVVFLWVATRGYLPVDLGTVTEGDGPALWAAASDLARVERRGPATGDLGPLPAGAVRFRVAPLWARVPLAFAVTAVLRPVAVSLAFVAVAGLFATLGRAETGLGAAAGAGFIVLWVAARELARWWREPRGATFALAVEGGHLRVWGPSTRGTIPLDQVRRVYRWPGGSRWIQVANRVVFVPRRAVDGDRAALVAALHDGTRR